MRTMTFTAAAAISLIGGGALAQENSAQGDILERARNAGNLGTLIQGIDRVGLAETLTGEGPYTVFAPTDAAFDALPDGTMDELMMEDGQEELTAILTYHVVPGEVMAGDLSDGQSIETVSGEDLDVTVDGETIMVGDATVTEADIQASNGVIHVIDAVLVPNGDM